MNTEVRTPIIKSDNGFFNLNSPVKITWLEFENEINESIKYPLSPDQLKAIMYILGIDITEHGEFESYSDDSLNEFISAIKDKFNILDE